MAEREKYEEMAAALQNYVKTVKEQLDVMRAAGADCVDNTNGDKAAATSVEKLNNSLTGFYEPLDRIGDVIDYLLREIERIEEAARAAEYND